MYVNEIIRQKYQCIKDHYDKLKTNKPIQMFYNDLFNREEYTVDGIPFLFIKRRWAIKYDNSVEYIDLTDYWLDLKGEVGR